MHAGDASAKHCIIGSLSKTLNLLAKILLAACYFHFPTALALVPLSATTLINTLPKSIDNMPTTVDLTSTCHCGQTSLSVSSNSLQSVTSRQNNSPHDAAVDCYCRSCRRYHVTAFVSYLMAPTDSVTIKGPTQTFRDICTELGIVDRLYCSGCFTKIATRPRASANYMDTTLVNMGPLDDETIPKTMAQSWRNQRNKWHVDDQAPWVDAVPNASQETVGRQFRQHYLRGGCSCGAARYRVDCASPYAEEDTGQFSTELQHCYCRLCRQMSGSAYQTWLPVYNHDWEWSGASPPLVRTTDHGKRHICKECGGVLTIVYDDQPDYTWPAAGGLDVAEPLPDTKEEMEKYLYRVCHICCRYKQKWYKLPDDGLERIRDAC